MPAQPLRTLLASSTPILRGKPGSMIFFSWFWEGEIFLWPSCVHCQQVILKWLCNESECNPMMLSKGVPPSFLEGYFKSIAVSWVKSLCSCSCQQSFTSVCASAREGVVPGVGMAAWSHPSSLTLVLVQPFNPSRRQLSWKIYVCLLVFVVLFCFFFSLMEVLLTRGLENMIVT